MLILIIFLKHTEVKKKVEKKMFLILVVSSGMLRLSTKQTIHK